MQGLGRDLQKRHKVLIGLGTPMVSALAAFDTHEVSFNDDIGVPQRLLQNTCAMSSISALPILRSQQQNQHQQLKIDKTKAKTRIFFIVDPFCS